MDPVFAMDETLSDQPWKPSGDLVCCVPRHSVTMLQAQVCRTRYSALSDAIPPIVGRCLNEHVQAHREG